MDIAIIVIGLVVIAVGAIFVSRAQADAAQRRLDEARAASRRWIERLGEQLAQLEGRNTASGQALADAAERFAAAASRLERAQTDEQAGPPGKTALEGLYYVRAARIAMDLDPGPALPGGEERVAAGVITAHRRVEVDDQHYEATPRPGERTPHYHPGGDVAGRPVPQGWYSAPWWKPALVSGAWGLEAALVVGGLFAGMAGPYGDSGYAGFEALEGIPADRGESPS